MNAPFPMEEQPFWAVIEQTRQATTQQEQTQRLAYGLHALSPEQIRAFDQRFRSLSNDLFPSQSLRQLLLNRHYTWGDDSWHYFLSWIIMQGNDAYTLASHASANLLPLIHAHSKPAKGLADIPTWFRPRWLPDFEGSAYVAGKVYLKKTGHEIEEDEAQEDEHQQEPEPNEWEALRIARARGHSLLLQGLRRLAARRKQEEETDLNEAAWASKQFYALNRHVLNPYGTHRPWSLDRHRYEEALEAFKQVLRLQPDNLFAHRKKGQALQALGRYEEALIIFGQLIHLTPEDLSLFYEKGALFFEAERYCEALAVFDQIFRRNPDDAMLHYYQGLALLRLGRIQEALGAFEQTLQLDPDYLPAYIAQGKLLVQSGRSQEALHACEQVLRLNPQTAWAVQTHQVLLRHVERNDQ
ncbi:tetratricopeptide repeat protein [Ktedonobacter racemifer]|uniref:TPR repeat-containing protein n=1 Tax=Ktedonobacter racemifer DSM 44963 TaxID=485913 RepID=D6TK27_KTERA|nr:tetratricopeptide repeat protein [Ktedonobacter racemifer]EFH79826.1 TPR repeat-containing protein [Ktedonobacter racemifer DSM 44963]EFH80450.1 TPR repeat-containing protein [Ktedonobacter racemifer DSM 44963]EFH89784.1 TPR repeat-containing protein [Ktedonobacter racemifer DSM 44963]